MIDDNEVDILIESSSQISNFAFDRENKTIAFNVSGYGGGQMALQYAMLRNY
jgi:hypothetical protein